MRVATRTDTKQTYGHVKKDVEQFSFRRLSDLCCVNVLPRKIITLAQQEQVNLAEFMKGKLLKCIYENVSCLCCCLIAAAPHSALKNGMPYAKTAYQTLLQLLLLLF